MQIQRLFSLITAFSLTCFMTNVLAGPPCRPHRDKLRLAAAMGGYDVYKANPWSRDGGDPGVKNAIFLHECTNPSNGFYQFIGITPDHNCNTDFTTETVTSYQEYMKAQTGSVSVAQEISASASVDTPFVSVSASYSSSSSDDQQQSDLKNFFEQNHGEVSLAKASCYTNDISILSNLRPVFHPNFIAALKNLDASLSGSSTEQRTQFISFVQSFGTHYANKVDFGVALIHRTFYNERSTTSKVQQMRNSCNSQASSACLGGGGGGFGVTVSVEACYKKEAEECQKNENESASGATNAIHRTRTLSIGTRPLELSDWITSDFTPVPIKRSLKLMSTLFKNEWLTQNTDYGFDVTLNGVELQRLYNTLIEDYCPIMLGRECPEENLKGCGINDDCGFRECRNKPNSAKGYDCVFQQVSAQCVTTGTTIENCNLDLRGTKVITQDTIIRNVGIRCLTSGTDCIYIGPGAKLSIEYSSARGNRNSRFIKMDGESELKLKNVKVSNFQKNENGGVISATNQNSIEIINSEFESNNAIGGHPGGNGGCIYMQNDGNLVIKGTTFLNNGAGNRGGAVHIENSVLTVDNTVFNRSRANTFGGGVSAIESIVSISNTKFINNWAKFWGGGMYFYNGSNIADLDTVTFQENHANLDGGGMYIHTSSVKLTKSVLMSNTCDRDGSAMAIRGKGTHVTMHGTKNIIHDNGGLSTVYCKERATVDLVTGKVPDSRIYNIWCTINFT